jgi:hypothetical protein
MVGPSPKRPAFTVVRGRRHGTHVAPGHPAADQSCVISTLSCVMPGGSAIAVPPTANVANAAKMAAIAIRANFILPPNFDSPGDTKVSHGWPARLQKERDRDRRDSEVPKYWVKKGSHTRQVITHNRALTNG